MDQRRKAIYDHLENYLTGVITLDAFKDWLIGATWDIEKTAPSATVELAYAIELVLAEASGGYLTRDELRAELRALAKHMPLASRVRLWQRGS